MFTGLSNKINQILYKKFKVFSFFLLRFGLGISFILHGSDKFPLPPENLMKFFNFGPILSSFVALSEISSGVMLIVSGFINKKVGNYLTRLSAFIIVIIMICAFYFAHSDWFINSKLFKSEQIFLLLIGIFFLVNGNEIKK